MAKVLIIGGTGHIGSYLAPRLVRAGHDVQVVCRTPEPKYTDPRVGWPAVKWIVADRGAEEKSGRWLERMRGIEVDVVIDLMCFTLEQQQTMYDAFAGRVQHFLHCGTVWAYGPTEYAPYEESHPRRPSTDYGVRKVQIENFLYDKYCREGFPATVIHPGHICGRKWLPVDPQGSRNGVDVFRRLARGEEVLLPDNGLYTLAHVHGDDVAQMFELATTHRGRALGESFSCVAPYAMSLLGCCRAVAAMFGREPNVKFVPLAELAHHISEAAYRVVVEHVSHSPCSSIDKARRLLGYAPRYTTEQIFAECIEHALETGELTLD